MNLSVKAEHEATISEIQESIDGKPRWKQSCICCYQIVSISTLSQGGLCRSCQDDQASAA